MYGRRVAAMMTRPEKTGNTMKLPLVENTHAEA
ncbi:hypothetical protein EES45_28895 [Streptomyces sp. ADI97-07]|uniref:Uncharacterized protein n=1 Tax=Streptomyces clavifer TaxID=68188 RepID=A0ABS4VES7_9ACTN|nr:hypothetical protein [Streptomyces clavifer]RPK73843.1 hypothetical protein EES45_28895 [Streptomyces sp. ADI97-07]